MNSLKVLIVEDEILIAEHIKDHLIQFGVQQISMAHNKEAALTMLESEKPNLVLLDMHLQHPLDGLELAKLIDTELKLPYIFITANSDMLVIKEAVQTNATAYITKPIKQSDLFAAIQLSLKSGSISTEKHLLIKDRLIRFKRFYRRYSMCKKQWQRFDLHNQSYVYICADNPWIGCRHNCQKHNLCASIVLIL